MEIIRETNEEFERKFYAIKYYAKKMKKSKAEIRKVNGRIVITNGETNVWGLLSWSEARKFLRYLKPKKYVKIRK